MDHADIRDLIIAMLVNDDAVKSPIKRNLDGAASGIDLKMLDGSEFQISVVHRKNADSDNE